MSTAALLAMAGYEICGLIATYIGSQQTQALIPHLKSRCLCLGCTALPARLATVASLGLLPDRAGAFLLRPSFLLALMFGVLALAERQFSRAEWTIAHVQPSSDGLTAPGRPVYTMQQPSWNKMC